MICSGGLYNDMGTHCIAEPHMLVRCGVSMPEFPLAAPVGFQFPGIGDAMFLMGSKIPNGTGNLERWSLGTLTAGVPKFVQFHSAVFSLKQRNACHVPAPRCRKEKKVAVHGPPNLHSFSSGMVPPHPYFFFLPSPFCIISSLLIVPTERADTERFSW